MGWGRSVSGYKPKRSGGCMPLVIWLGVAFNIMLILYSISDERGLSLSRLFNANADEATLALQAFAGGDLNAAVTHAQQAWRTDRTQSAALMTLVRALIYRSYIDFKYRDDLPQALTVAAAAADQFPEEPNVLAAYAFALQANGQGAPAAEAAEAALAINPDHTLARTALGLAYARVGSFEIGLRESQAALTNDTRTPEILEARRAVAIATADLGNYNEAGALLDDLIAQHGRIIPYHFERALYARQVGDAERAETAYLRVLNLDPTNVKARLRLCELANSIGERDTAQTYCEEVTTSSPNLPEGWHQLGRIHFLNGEFAQAQQALNRCSSLQVLQDVPSSERIFECWYLQGQAAEIQQDCASLIAIYNQFQIMATDSAVRETWVYPPEGPPICQ